MRQAPASHPPRPSASQPPPRAAPQVAPVRQPVTLQIQAGTGPDRSIGRVWKGDVALPASCEGASASGAHHSYAMVVNTKKNPM